MALPVCLSFLLVPLTLCIKVLLGIQALFSADLFNVSA